MRPILSILLVGITAGLCLAQSTDQLAQHIQDVTIKGNVYEQALDKQTKNNCLISISVLDTKKGEETIFELNAADLNEHAISFDTRKSSVMVSAQVQGKRNLIRVYEDGEIDGYDDEMTLLAAGIEEARELVDSFKQMVKECNEKASATPESVAGTSAQDWQAFLEKEINTVEINGEQFAQAFSCKSAQPHLIQYEMTEPDKGELNTYEFNLTDLNESKVSFDTKGTSVWVSAQTRGERDLIKHTTNGEVKGYQDEVVLLARDIEHARLIEQVWKKLISATESNNTGFMAGNQNPTIEQTLAFLTKQTGKVTINEEAYEQKMSYQKSPHSYGGYLMTYTVNDLSKAEESVFQWNILDVNPASLVFDTKRSDVFVNLQTQAKDDLIAYHENGNLKAYTNGLNLRANSIEEARALSMALSHLATKTKEMKPEPTLPDSYTATLSYVQQRVGDINLADENYQQSLSAQEGKECLLSYKLTDENEGDEYAYHWNLNDLSESSIAFQTKKDKVLVVLRTSGKKELIEVVENGEVDKYEDELSIMAEGIEEAREIVAGLKHLSTFCKTK